MLGLLVGLGLAVASVADDEIAAGDAVDDDDDGVDLIAAANDDDFARVHHVNGSGHPHREHGSLHADVSIHANISDALLECDFRALHGPAFVLKCVCTVLHSHTMVPLRHQYLHHQLWMLNWLQPLPPPMWHLSKILYHLWSPNWRRSTLWLLYLLVIRWLCHPYYLVLNLRQPLLLASSLALVGY